MSELRVLMDPYNPGHYYACCGLLELAAREDADARAMFENRSGSVRRANFLLSTTDGWNLERTLTALRDAEVQLIDHTPLQDHSDKAVEPVLLKLSSGEMLLDWWLDWFRERPVNLKCWAGQVTTGKLMEELLAALPVEAGGDRLFFEGRMMKTKFGIDPRSAWSSLDVGYSPNEHNQDAATFPAVELLGAIGLQGYRPLERTRDKVPLHLWHAWLGRVPARRAAVMSWPGLASTPMSFRIAKRGQSYKYFTFAEPRRDKTDEQL